VIKSGLGICDGPGTASQDDGSLGLVGLIFGLVGLASFGLVFGLVGLASLRFVFGLVGLASFGLVFGLVRLASFRLVFGLVGLASLRLVFGLVGLASLRLVFGLALKVAGGHGLASKFEVSAQGASVQSISGVNECQGCEDEKDSE